MMVRLGAAAIGILTGTVIGFMLAILFAATTALPFVPFAGWVFGTPFVLAGIYFVKPSIAFALFPGLAHFFAGAATAVVSYEDLDRPSPEPGAPGSAKISFYFGVAVAILVLVAFRYFR